MTLSLAWVRTLKNTSELVVATDSRLTGGLMWDCAPKILPLNRGDAVLCFSGRTAYAYPIMLQIINSINQYQRSNNRAAPLEDIKGHCQAFINRMIEKDLLRDFPIGTKMHKELEFNIILAGYSWYSKKFRIWTLKYNKNASKLIFTQIKPKRLHSNMHFHASGDYIPEFKRKLNELLRDRKKSPADGLDFEPFEVLRDMIRDSNYREIGGAPQIYKVYQFLNHMPYGIYWPNKASGSIWFNGRPFIEGERTSYKVIDPDTLDIHNTWSYY